MREAEPGASETNLLTIDGIAVRVFGNRAAAIRCAADRVSSCLAGRSVLALPTGRTPIDLYRELRDRHQLGAISFAQAETFNLDEYWPIEPTTRGSFRRFMREHLFDHVDLAPERAHLPDGRVERAAVASECTAYEAAITRAGGLDLAILGIGRNGHVGFNEPGSPIDSRTRLVELTAETRRDNERDFDDPQTIPQHALTMGIATILSARALMVLAFGAAKAEILAHALRGPIDASCPASFLRTVAPRVEFLLDPAAAARLAEDTVR